ncbi:MAG TPA: hypothetical protein VHE11_14215 [Steroidobacteraceae bacterium]|nr:hypothetical protein [Steroidobacteraceae bacterium]
MAILRVVRSIFAMSVLTLTQRPLGEQIEALDRGLPSSALGEIAVTPGEYNLMINPRHPGWQWRWVVSGPRAFAFDARLAELMEQSHKPGTMGI